MIQPTTDNLHRRALLTGAAASLAAACATPGLASRGGLYFPPAHGGAWETTTAAEAGWDPAGLEAALAYAGENASEGVVLLHKGRILAERYWQGRGPTDGRDVASAQKSVVSFMAGALMAQTALRETDPVERWLGPGWSRASREQEAAITVRHLLTMTSGLNDELAFEAAPGARWRYNNEAYHRNHAVLTKVTGEALNDLTRRLVFAPTGMSPTAQWRSRGGGDPKPGLVMAPRDMARFGLLALAGGRWNGRSLIPADYVSRATTSSSPLNPSYGYLWWLNGKGAFRFGPGVESTPRDIIPSAPDDLFAALGANDQKIYVIPSLDLVAVRLGQRAGSRSLAVSSFDASWWERLAAAAPARA